MKHPRMEIIIVLALFFWLAQMEKAKKQKKAKAGQERDFVSVPPTKEQEPVQLDMLDELDDMTPEDMTPEPMDDLCEGARIETMEGKDPCHPAKPMEGTDPCHPATLEQHVAQRVTERKEMQHRLRVNAQSDVEEPVEEASEMPLEFTPEAMRQAFVMNEILTRPCERKRKMYP